MHHIFRWPVYPWGGWIAKFTLEMFVRICLTGRHLARFGGCRKHPWSKWWSGGGNFGQLVYRQKELVVMAATAAVWAPFLIRGGGISFSLKWFGGLFFFHSGSWWLCASQSCASYPIKSLVFVSRTLTCDSLRVCLVFFLFLKTSPLKMFSMGFFSPKMATWS